MYLVCTNPGKNAVVSMFVRGVDFVSGLYQSRIVVSMFVRGVDFVAVVSMFVRGVDFVSGLYQSRKERGRVYVC